MVGDHAAGHVDGDGAWPMGVFAVYPPTPRVPARTRVLVDFLVERLREPPWAGITA